MPKIAFRKVPCRLCGELTMRAQTQLCDPCWELERRVLDRPELALKILWQHWYPGALRVSELLAATRSAEATDQPEVPYESE